MWFMSSAQRVTLSSSEATARAAASESTGRTERLVAFPGSRVPCLLVPDAEGHGDIGWRWLELLAKLTSGRTNNVEWHFTKINPMLAYVACCVSILRLRAAN